MGSAVSPCCVDNYSASAGEIDVHVENPAMSEAGFVVDLPPKADRHSGTLRNRMLAKGVTKELVVHWLELYGTLCTGDRGYISKARLEPPDNVRELSSLPDGDAVLLGRTCVLKLNGGLGTRMGLDMPKGLLEVKPGFSFLDVFARQAMGLQELYPGHATRFMLMSSSFTEADSGEFVKRYPEVFLPDRAVLSQSLAPMVDAATLAPASFPSRPTREWFPPGSGDLAVCLAASGRLEELLEAGYEYLFVSDCDNLCATMDLRLLGHLANSEAPVLLEVCRRGEDDRHRGHLAKEAGDSRARLVVRELAQCSPVDEQDFQDIQKYRYSNTNSLWFNLKKLASAVVEGGGKLPLPLVVKQNRIDPSSKDHPGPSVFQLETALASAVTALPGAEVICVPPARFAPVKSWGELLALRSDAVAVEGPEYTPTTAPGALSTRPHVDLSESCKVVEDMVTLCPPIGHGVPSLRECTRLTIEGRVRFAPGAICRGQVRIVCDDPHVCPEVAGVLTGNIDPFRRREVPAGSFASGSASSMAASRVAHGNSQVTVATAPSSSLVPPSSNLAATLDGPEATVLEPKEFVVKLQKRNSTGVVGLTLGITAEDTELLRVHGVGAGLVSAWNASWPDYEVRRGDIVVEINGVRGDAERMMTAAQAECDELHLVLCRPAVDLRGL